MEIFAVLEDGGCFFEETVGAVPESEATRRLTPESWSILRIVEHVVLAERGLLGRFDGAERTESSLYNAEREAQLAPKLRERTWKLQAPERVWPAGRFATVAEALEQFRAARIQTLRLAREKQAELYNLRIAHPFFGDVNGVEMLLAIASHGNRHADQILEITGVKPDPATVP